MANPVAMESPFIDATSGTPPGPLLDAASRYRGISSRIGTLPQLVHPVQLIMPTTHVFGPS